MKLQENAHFEIQYEKTILFYVKPSSILVNVIVGVQYVNPCADTCSSARSISQTREVVFSHVNIVVVVKQTLPVTAAYQVGRT